MIFAIRILFTFLSASASNCLFHEADFVDSAVALKKMSLPLAIVAASPKFQLTDESGKTLETCSGEYVSDDGSLMTSGHCVDECLKAAGAYIQQDGLSRVQRDKLSGITCAVRLNGGAVLKAEVLAISECRLAEKVTATSTCKGGDYALLRIEGAVAPACFRVSDQPASPNTNVAGIGSPEKSFRYGQRDGASESDGLHQQFSSGVVLLPKASCYKNTDLDAGETAFPNNFRAAYLINRTQAGVFLQTSVDAIRGSSGGPLIDLNTGQLVGVHSMDLINGQFVECKGGTFFSAMDKIVEDIKTNYPNLNIARVLGCDAKAIIKK